MGRDCDFSTPPCLRPGCEHSYISHKMIQENGCYPVFGPCLFPDEPWEMKKNPPKCTCPRFVHTTSHYTTGEEAMFPRDKSR